MADLGIASPLVGASAAVAPQDHLARASLRCAGDAVEAVSARLGVALPRAACTSAHAGGRAALWLGPDEWLVLDREAQDGWATGLAETLHGLPCALVDVSHRQVALAVQGPRCADILATGCALDLAPAAFPVGMCTRTMFAKAEIVLWRRADDLFHLEVWRSFARYVDGLLRVAERESELMAMDGA